MTREELVKQQDLAWEAANRELEENKQMLEQLERQGALPARFMSEWFERTTA